ncbi:MAG: zinc-ribbon domain-containing protein [Deltaproteobacteria bacterium]|nr:MAG: zinc-ribbon domain-containing protein [Deltaproteobacteria bacterium]
MKIQCPQCKSVYSAETMEIPIKGISVKCQKCNSPIFIPRVPVLDTQLCSTCGYIKQTQDEGDTFSTKCPKCGAP